MRFVLVAAAAALALAACGQGGTGTQLPPVQSGAQAPMQLPAQQAAQQANLTAEQRTQLEQLVAGYLNNVQQNFGSGLSPAPGFSDHVAGMQPGTDDRWVVDLIAATPYRVIGSCDNECSNMDIELIDMNTGGVVASDVLPDDFPVVDFQPPANGRYMVRMIMQTCTVAPCYAGARVLARTPSTGTLGKP
ncbi:MAG: hypothetical protein ACT4OF_04810 [Caulobacteraceae bacterium]